LGNRESEEETPKAGHATASQSHARAAEPAPDDAPLSDYAVGWRHPPLETRFQKEKSGNPAGGRKRKAPYKPLLDQFRELLAEQMTVTVGGRRKRMSNRELLLRSMISGAQKGNYQARKQVIALLLAVDARDRATASSFINHNGKVHEFSWSDAHKKMLRDLDEACKDLKDE
jgi:hypothetical protein